MVNGVGFAKHAITATFEIFIMNEHDLKKLNTILNNIKLIRGVRDQIEHLKVESHKDRNFKCVGMRPRDMYCNDVIQLDEGLCHNLDLFAIDDIKSLSWQHPLFRLGNGWIDIMEGDGNDEQRSDIFPIANDPNERCNMFANPERWDYMDYVERQVKHIIEHGKFSDE